MGPVGAAVFGGVIGSFRGGVQIFYGAVKVPLAMLAALAICAPAFHALAAGFGRAWPMRSIIALALAAAGRASLVLLALSPALWLLFDLGMGYHSAALAAAFAYAAACTARNLTSPISSSSASSATRRKPSVASVSATCRLPS